MMVRNSLLSCCADSCVLTRLCHVCLVTRSAAGYMFCLAFGCVQKVFIFWCFQPWVWFQNFFNVLLLVISQQEFKIITFNRKLFDSKHQCYCVDDELTVSCWFVMLPVSGVNLLLLEQQVDSFFKVSSTPGKYCLNLLSLKPLILPSSSDEWEQAANQLKLWVIIYYYSVQRPILGLPSHTTVHGWIQSLELTHHCAVFINLLFEA